MSKIRVLHIITRLIRGGADENTVFSAEGLPPEAYDVALASGPDSEKEMRQRLRNSKFVVVPSLQREINPIKDLKALLQLVRIMKQGRYQVVHTHVAKAGILGRFAAKLAGVPVVIHTLHGITFHPHLPTPVRLLYLFLERLADHCTDLFIDVGEDLKQTYVSHGIGRADKHVVVRSGFDVHRFLKAGQHRAAQKAKLLRRLGLPEGSLLVGTAARLERRKGIKYFIDAAKQITERIPNVYFLVAGQGRDGLQLQTYGDSVGLNGRLRFTGFETEIAEYLAGLDLFVLSSLWEGLPRILVQAGAVGIPVVSFRVEGVHEVVTHGGNGFVVPSRDVEALLGRVTELLQNPARAQQMGQYARKNLLADWDYKNMIQQIEAIYQRLLTKKGIACERGGLRWLKDGAAATGLANAIRHEENLKSIADRIGISDPEVDFKLTETAIAN